MNKIPSEKKNCVDKIKICIKLQKICQHEDDKLEQFSENRKKGKKKIIITKDAVLKIRDGNIIRHEHVAIINDQA